MVSLGLLGLVYTATKLGTVIDVFKIEHYNTIASPCTWWLPTDNKIVGHIEFMISFLSDRSSFFFLYKGSNSWDIII